jgi:hypothetical protein
MDHGSAMVVDHTLAHGLDADQHIGIAIVIDHALARGLDDDQGCVDQHPDHEQTLDKQLWHTLAPTYLDHVMIMSLTQTYFLS